MARKTDTTTVRLLQAVTHGDKNGMRRELAPDSVITLTAAEAQVLLEAGIAESAFDAPVDVDLTPKPDAATSSQAQLSTQLTGKGAAKAGEDNSTGNTAGAGNDSASGSGSTTDTNQGS